MKAGQILIQVTSRILQELTSVSKEFKSDGLVVRGDTATRFAANLGAYYGKISVGFDEAGLGTGNI
jgi:UDP-N-acetylglucosamine 2-epimerase (non-hydrolysing)